MPRENGSAPAAIVLLASGAGTLAQSVLDAAARPGAAFEVVSLVADRDCQAVDRARAAGIPAEAVLPHDHRDRAAWDAALTAAVRRQRPDWVVSAGFMRILGREFLSAFPNRVLNTHPALLPSFPGSHAVRDALHHGVRVSGCTVHLVDAGVDTGPIIAQQAVEVYPEDSESSLHERIKVCERELLVDVLEAAACGRLHIDGRKVVRS